MSGRIRRIALSGIDAGASVSTFSLNIETSLLIPASAERVWDALTDQHAYAAWSPFVKDISGRLAVGEMVKVRVQAAGTRERSFNARVAALVPGQELRWRGFLVQPWILRAEHFFQLRKLSPAQTLLIHGEHFQGLAIPFARRFLERARGRFEEMNKALATRVGS